MRHASEGDRSKGKRRLLAPFAFVFVTITHVALPSAFARAVSEASSAVPDVVRPSVGEVDAMVREAGDRVHGARGNARSSARRGENGTESLAVAPIVDGAADWIAPRIAPRPLRVRPPRALPSAGTAHAPRPLFGAIDAATFLARTATPMRPFPDPFALAGIGFPQIERLPSDGRRHHRRFRALLDWHAARAPHARVRCMNLPSHVVARRAAPYAPTIERLAVEHGLAPSLVMAVVARESCFDPAAVSRAGAMGLMQLMPATARELGTGNPWTPADNLRGGVRYLARMHALFGTTELALAAYNAGPGAVRRHGGIPPYAETRAYVARVLAYQRRYRALELVASL